MSEEDKKSIEKTEKVKEDEARDERNVPAKRHAPVWLPWVAGGTVVVILLVAAYSIGLQVGKGNSTTVAGTNGFGSMMRGYGDFDDSSSSQSTQNGMPSGDFRGGRGTMGGSGTVTAVSSTSISIKGSMGGGITTYTINSSTTVTDGSSTKAVSDIATGDTVRVTPSTSDTTIAATITIGS